MASNPTDDRRKEVRLLQLPDHPAKGSLAADPKIRKLLREHPEVSPHVEWLDRISVARAEAEVIFRKQELHANWQAWSGVHPFDDVPDIETTECPWWLPGGEFVFHLMRAWRKWSPGTPERKRAELPLAIKVLAEEVYNAKVCFHDYLNANGKGLAEHLNPEKNWQRFCDFAVLFVLKRFAEAELEEWQRAVEEARDPEEERGKKRSRWLDERYAERGWT